MIKQIMTKVAYVTFCYKTLITHEPMKIWANLAVLSNITINL